MNKTSISIAIVLSGLVLTTVSFKAQACGETLFHSGQAMRYQSFITRQPADILIYRPGVSDDNVAQKLLDSGLEKAGHRVTLVTSNAELTRALAANRYDVIIAGAHDMDVVAARLDNSGREPSLVAVLGPNAAQDSVMRGHYSHTLREQDGLNQYLRLIEQTMDSRHT